MLHKRTLMRFEQAHILRKRHSFDHEAQLLNLTLEK